MYITVLNCQSLKGKLYNKNAIKYPRTMLLGNKESWKKKDLNAAQTWLNEKLLEVNICLSCVFSVMFSNYKAARICWLHQTREIGFPPHLSCYDAATLRYLTELRQLAVCFGSLIYIV